MESESESADEGRGYLVELLVAAARVGLVRPELSTIAREAGVSIASVRVVLSGGPASEAMRARVLAVLGLGGDGDSEGGSP